MLKICFFFAPGKSIMCFIEERGCNCPTCPITTEYGMKYQKFCLRGSEMTQRCENTLWEPP